MIKIDNLGFKYDTASQNSLNEVNLEIAEGEVILILGPSGSGKSTLALTINGLIPHTIPGEMKGNIQVCGLDTLKTPVYELTQKVGIVFQDPEAQFVSLNVEDELVFGLENLCFTPEEMEERLVEALEKVDMLEYRHRDVYSLSGGEKQKILLAALMAMRPSVLIFDEPTANLDPVGTLEFFEKLKSLKETETHTIILIEHKLDDLMHLVDRVQVIGKKGVKITEGTPREVFGLHAETLIKEGIWMPQTALLSYELQKNNNIKLPETPLTIQEACNHLKNLKTLTINPNNIKTELSRNSTGGLLGKFEKGLSFNPSEELAENLAGDLRAKNNPNQGLPTNSTIWAENVGTNTLKSSELALEIRDLSFSYKDKKVINDVSLKVPKGDFLAIVGANGAGKTTLAKHMVNIIQPSPNTVFVEGADVLNIPSHDLSQKIGYVFQNPEHQFIKDTVEEQLTFGLELKGFSQDEIDNWLNITLSQFNIYDHKKMSPYMLSHGQKRLLSVATMLTLGQDILILDEPTFGQDLKSSGELLRFLKSLNNEGKTILMITHDMALVAKYAKNVVVMAAGEMIFQGDTKDLFKNEEILHKARLTPPPLLKLSNCLSEYDENWKGLSTPEEFCQYIINREE